MKTHADIWLKSLTKDHESSLKKQQEDVNSLRRQLDHVISFTKWATGSQSGTALLYCKRLVCTTAVRIASKLKSDCCLCCLLEKSWSHICYLLGWPQQLACLNLNLSSAASPLALITSLNSKSLFVSQDHFSDSLSDESKL